MKSFTTFIIVLLEYRCYPAATCVADKICSVISSNGHLVPTLSQQNIDSYIDAIISLEIHSEAVGKRGVLEKFISPVFTILTPLQQCRLLVDLQANDNARLRGSPTCLELKNLTKSLMQIDLSKIAPEEVVKVIDYHLQLNDKEILDKLVDHILLHAENTTDIVLLEKLLTKARFSPIAKSSLLEVLARRIESLAQSIRESPWEENDSWRSKLTCFLLILLRIESYPELSNSTRLASLIPIYQKIPVQELAHLISNVYQALKDEVLSLREIPTALNLYRELCQQFVNKSEVISWCKMPDSKLVETAESLLWIGDESFSIFADKILAAHPIYLPNDVIRKIAESDDILKLSDSFPPARESLCRLLQLRVSAVMEFFKEKHPAEHESLLSPALHLAYADFRSTHEASVLLYVQTERKDEGQRDIIFNGSEGPSKVLLVLEMKALNRTLVNLLNVQRDDSIVELPCPVKDIPLIDISD